MTDSPRPAPLSVRRPRDARPATTPARDAAVAVVHREPAAAPALRTLNSTALLQGHSYVSIVHNGETYQLRATRFGKLILTK